ncbi:beta-lactamase-like protein [Phyllosticta paracitricarpa]|uniref:Beta-lactamase-like protein n=1 Tax=Phyllosticta citricarpa TaxID=55181 RepID=A0ABR1LXB2_9PEZI
MADHGIKSETLSSLDIPPSGTAVEISIIDTTTDIVCPAAQFVSPILQGHEAINMPTWAFYIKHPSGKEILFDLGARKDWWTTTPSALNAIKGSMLGIKVRKGIDEILTEGGVDVNRISSLIVSHWHWDHIGDPSRFPSSAELVVGPGFKESLMPGYPANPDAHLLDSMFSGRTVREVPFDPAITIGGLESHDFFGDGSFYVLNTPGHATGHISALARTTTAGGSTFVFLGGDICHFSGVFRPTSSKPLPDTIPASPSLPLNRRGLQMPCPCSFFTSCHPAHKPTPFYTIPQVDDAWYADPPTAQHSVDLLQRFDADPRVLVAIAHDESLRGVVPWFPDGSLNKWGQCGWKEQARWGFLGTLPRDGKPADEPLVVGLIGERGERVERGVRVEVGGRVW